MTLEAFAIALGRAAMCVGVAMVLAVALVLLIDPQVHIFPFWFGQPGTRGVYFWKAL